MYYFIFNLAIVDDFNNSSSDSDIFINDSHNDSEFKSLSKQIESFLSRLNRDPKFRSKLLEELFEKLVNNDDDIIYEKTEERDFNDNNNRTNANKITEDEDQIIICNTNQNENAIINKQKSVSRDDENDIEYSMQNEMQSMYPKYHCKFCPKIFQQISFLIQHQRENHQYKFGCGQCKAQFRDEYVFRIHLRKFGCSKRFGIPALANIELHESENDLQASMPIRNHICQWPGCGKTFTRGSYLSNHMMTHSTERNFICNWSGCDKRYKTQAHLLNHLLVHKQHENYELPCPAMDCTMRFLGESELRHHYYNEHVSEKQEMQKISRSLTTKLSNEDIPKKCKTITSIKVVEAVDDPVKYHCDFENCNFLATDVIQLQKHEKEKHAELLPFKCGQCGTSFKKKSSLSNHVKSHSGEFICSWNECRFRTNSSLILNRHIMSHNDYIINTNQLQEKKFTCKLCKKVFSKRASIINHIRSHSGNYSCQWPGCFFASQSKMLYRRHVIANKHDLDNNNNDDMLIENEQTENNSDQQKQMFNEDSNQNEQQLSPFDLMVMSMKKDSKMKKKEEKIKQEIEDEEDYGVRVISSNDKSTLKQHSITLNSTIMTKSNENKLLQMYHCRYPNCSYQTNKRPLFRVHRLKHSEERKHHCSWAKCGKSFKAKSTLNRHLMRHQRMALSRPNNPSMIILEDEEEDDDNEEDNGLDIQKTLQEPKNSKKIKTQPVYEFECDQCGLSFRTKASLSNHRVSHRKPFNCKYPNCYFETFRITVMERHEKETHGNKEMNINIKKVYRCNNNNCDKTFPNLNELNQHSSVHEHRFVCFWAGCKSTFNSKASFAEHLQSHQMERKFNTTYNSTPNCQKTFGNKRGLVDLIAQDGERKLKCTFPGCNYTSSMSSTLKKHIYRQHKKPRLNII